MRQTNNIATLLCVHACMYECMCTSHTKHFNKKQKKPALFLCLFASYNMKIIYYYHDHMICMYVRAHFTKNCKKKKKKT